MKSEKLSFSFKFAFGVGQAGEGCFGQGLGFFLLFYYSQILGLSPGLAGTAIGIAVIIDAGSDVFAGSISDRLCTRRSYPCRYVSSYYFSRLLRLNGAFLSGWPCSRISLGR